jgi:hypothetical protein
VIVVNGDCPCRWHTCARCSKRRTTEGLFQTRPVEGWRPSQEKKTAVFARNSTPKVVRFLHFTKHTGAALRSSKRRVNSDGMPMTLLTSIRAPRSEMSRTMHAATQRPLSKTTWPPSSVGRLHHLRLSSMSPPLEPRRLEDIPLKRGR